jgi:uncharacterized protein (DUF983 family)
VTARDSTPWTVLVARAWSGRCPRCGEGRLFARRFRLAFDCARCGLVFRREQGAMTGQMYLSAAVGQVLAALLFLGVWLWTDWSAGPALALTLPVMVAFSYWFLPRSMALWVAVEYLTDRGNREPWTRS